MSLTEGFICIDKPVGLTSFQVVHKVRKLSGVQKVGHCGTLDPFASGLLILAIGRPFTKKIDQFQALPKTYKANMIVGATTDTLDSEGHKTTLSTIPFINSEGVLSAFKKFKGKIQQMPPDFSAKKVNGKRAYELARKGEKVTLEPVEIEIYDLNLLDLSIESMPQISFRCHCSKGTYVRSLVRDIGRALDSEAYTHSLIREEIGEYSLERALKFDDLSEETIKSNLFYI